MAPTNEHHAIAASIDKAVSAFPDTAGGMEHLLVRMYKYMPDFKRILDTAAPGDMDMLCAQYPHFYRFAKLLEQLAESLAQKKGEAKEAPKPKPKPASKKPT
ncbi:MAG: arylsulfatase regulator [Chromatiaceae bacterium]